MEDIFQFKRDDLRLCISIRRKKNVSSGFYCARKNLRGFRFAASPSSVCFASFPQRERDICVEQPTHVSLIESIKLQEITAFRVEITSNGIDMERLENLFKYKNIKFFYTVSRFQNPTGYSYSNAEKRKIVELAKKYDVYIIEDDYMGDLDSNLKQDPMFAYDPSGRVIYTKSFSKVMLPGLDRVSRLFRSPCEPRSYAPNLLRIYIHRCSRKGLWKFILKAVCLRLIFNG